MEVSSSLICQDVCEISLRPTQKCVQCFKPGNIVSAVDLLKSGKMHLLKWDLLKTVEVALAVCCPDSMIFQ